MNKQNVIDPLDEHQALILSIAANSTLQALNISDCHLLKAIDGLANAKQITELCITGTEVPIHLDDLTDLKRLETIHLNLKWSSEQRSIHCENFQGLSSLKSLKLDYFKDLYSLD